MSELWPEWIAREHALADLCEKKAEGFQPDPGYYLDGQNIPPDEETFWGAPINYWQTVNLCRACAERIKAGILEGAPDSDVDLRFLPEDESSYLCCECQEFLDVTFDVDLVDYELAHFVENPVHGPADWWCLFNCAIKLSFEEDDGQVLARIIYQAIFGHDPEYRRPINWKYLAPELGA